MTKVILVTGASSGIGFDAAEAFARQGHRVYAAARRVERMEPLKALGVVPLPGKYELLYGGSSDKVRSKRFTFKK